MSPICYPTGVELHEPDWGMQDENIPFSHEHVALRTLFNYYEGIKDHLADALLPGAPRPAVGAGAAAHAQPPRRADGARRQLAHAPRQDARKIAGQRHVVLEDEHAAVEAHRFLPRTAVRVKDGANEVGARGVRVARRKEPAAEALVVATVAVAQSHAPPPAHSPLVRSEAAASAGSA